MKIVSDHTDEYKALTTEEKDKLIKDLEEAKAVKMKSRRISNKSKGNDISHTIGMITGKVRLLPVSYHGFTLIYHISLRI